jgi:cephalosporin hydroxylase
MSDVDAPGSESGLERIARLSGAPVEERLESPLRSYWIDRFSKHVEDSYAGVPLSKFPEDLRVYEHLLWSDRPNVVIEIGTQYGGSALWFRDRLRTLASYGLLSDFRVVTVDIEADRARPYLNDADPSWEERISVVSGDVCDHTLPDRIAKILPHAPRCFVVEDSAHTYATTMAALTGFARFVLPGGFFVVEDGCVDIKPMRVNIMRLGSKGLGPLRRKRWPYGVLPAVSDWLAGPAGKSFDTRRDLELYGVTCHPRGVLQRRASDRKPAAQ